MRKRRASIALRVLSTTLLALPALAGPTGEVVVEGQADFSRPDDQTTIIDTKTDTTIIEYDGFDILQGELVEIHQPTDQSKTLNHVPHGDPTTIAGKLWSNGFVYVVNPSGIFVGDTAVIDVGGLVAAAGRISYDDFMNGLDHFTDLGGEVVVADGALVRADDSVALLGQRVASYGTIVAEGGMVAFIAGNEAVLGSLDGHLNIRVDGGGDALADDQFALVQGGTVDAGSRVQLTAGDTYSLAMNHTGVTRAREIRLEAQADGLIQVAGTLDASALGAGESGGRVEVLGEKVAVLDARIDASGDAGGGAIRIGGDVQGGPGLRAAARTAVSNEAEIVADAVTTGDGGSIVVWSEEKTGFYGSASARGGADSGDGGFIEISGRQSLDARGHHVDLSAPNGRSGTLLYDPLAIEIRGSAGGPVDGSDSDAMLADALDGSELGRVLSGTVGDADPFLVYESELENTDANIVLQATEQIYVNEAFAFGNDDVVITDGNSLVIQTTGDAPAGFTASDYAIDLGSDLTWEVSGGGVIDIRTQAGDVADPDASTPANIRVGHLVFGGREFVDVDGVMRALNVVPDSSLASLGVGLAADIDLAGDAPGVNLRTDVGSVTVGSIFAMGQDASTGGLTQASAGAPVRITTGAGDITVVGKPDLDPTVGLVGIVTTGGSADPLSNSASFGGAGGNVTLQADEGSIFIDGSIDASGGDGLAGVVQVPGDDVQLFREGWGGRGGAVRMSAIATDAPIGRVEVRADVKSNGGAAEGLVTPPPGASIEGLGGASGELQINASGGVLVLGTDVDPVTIEVSGGAGTRLGGNAASPSEPVRIGVGPGFQGDATYEVVMRHARLVADGGDATAGGAGGTGGAGGNVLIDAGNGRVEAFENVEIQANGGNGARALFADGDVDPFGRGEQPGGGGTARTISVLGVAGVQLGDVVALGGDGENGNAGRGGALEATSDAGDVEVGDVTLNGGSATTNLADQAVLGGIGGNLTLRSGVIALSGEDPVPVGDVRLAGRILALGGSGVDADGDPTVASGGPLTLRSNQGIASVAPGASVEGGLVQLLAPSIGGPGAPIDIAGTAADGDRAVLTVQRSTMVPQSLHVDLLPSHANGPAGNGSGLESVEVVHQDEQADSLLSSDGTPILEVVGAAMQDGAAVLASMKTADTDPTLGFTLDTVGDDTGAVPAPDLEIAVNAVDLGTAGGSIRNVDGAIVAASGALGTDSHVEARGNVVLDGTEIGALGEAVRVDGALEASLALLARGDVHVDVVDAAAAGAFGAIDVTQRVATAETTILGLDGAGAVTGDPLLDVNDVTVDPDAPIAELTADTSSSATDLAYRHTATGPGGGTAPVLRMQQVVLGGDGLFSVLGDLELTDTAAASVALMGEGADLLLDTGGDLVVADADPGVAHVVMTEGDAMDPDDTADLLLDLGGSVVSPSGDTASLVTENVERFAADFLGDDLRLHNQVGSAAGLEIAQIQWLDPKDPTGETVEDTFSGILGGDFGAGEGNLELDNGTRRIVLGDIPSVSPSAPPVHVGVFGDVVFHSPVEVENARYVISPTAGDDDTVSSELVAINDAGIVAGGDVQFEGAIDTGAGSTAVDDITDPMEATPEPDVFVAASLRVDAQTATYEGDVGVGSPLRLFDTTDAVVVDTMVPGGTRTIHAADVVFRGSLDGPAALEIVGVPAALAPDDPETRVTFAGDVGQASPLAALDVQADHIAFALAGAGSAERVEVAGDVLLDTVQPTVPQAATISDAAGDLFFRTGGDFRVGALDKVSVVGGLQIVSDGTVTVGDLSASSIEIVSPDIVVTTRPPGPVELADGSLLPGGDGGVDWVANRIVTSSAPMTTDPTDTLSLYLGSGGVSIPGGLSAYRLRYASPDLAGVAGASLIGQDGRVLDLTGSGPPLVADPVRALPRRDEVGALPEESPRFGSEDPAARAEVSDREVLAFLRCSGFGPATGTDGCDAEDRAALASLDRIGDDALDTARAREITERYRELLATKGAIPRLRAAFAAAGRAYGESLEWRDGTLDGAAFYRFLASAPRSQARALASVRELAWLFAQIELLGLADADTRRLQNTLAQEFAAAAGLQGLDADAVVAAVDASPIGVPQP